MEYCDKNKLWILILQYSCETQLTHAALLIVRGQFHGGDVQLVSKWWIRFFFLRNRVRIVILMVFFCCKKNTFKIEIVTIAWPCFQEKKPDSSFWHQLDVIVVYDVDFWRTKFLGLVAVANQPSYPLPPFSITVNAVMYGYNSLIKPGEIRILKFVYWNKLKTVIFCTCWRQFAAGKSGKLSFLISGKSAPCRHPFAEAASSPINFIFMTWHDVI
jgi:hypothetical protein